MAAVAAVVVVAASVHLPKFGPADHHRSGLGPSVVRVAAAAPSFIRQKRCLRSPGVSTARSPAPCNL